MLAGLAGAREASRRMQCKANLRGLALAAHLHHDSKGFMPPYASGKGGELYGGWLIHLLPYLGHEAVYQELSADHQTEHMGFQLIGSFHSGSRAFHFPELVCHTDPTRTTAREPRTNYLANWYAFTDGTAGVYRPAQAFRQLTDGLTELVLFAEGYSECAQVPRVALFPYPYHNFGTTQHPLPSDDPSLAPADYTRFQIRPELCDHQRTQTAHSAMPVALADGSCRFVRNSVADETWKQVLKPRDGNPNDDW
jgi:hypothetical protein